MHYAHKRTIRHNKTQKQKDTRQRRTRRNRTHGTQGGRRAVFIHMYHTAVYAVVSGLETRSGLFYHLSSCTFTHSQGILLLITWYVHTTTKNRIYLFTKPHLASLSDRYISTLSCLSFIICFAWYLLQSIQEK